MFSFTTTNAIYQSNDNNELVKYNRHTGKQIKIDKVLPVKVQRAYTKWLEDFNAKEFKQLAEFDNQLDTLPEGQNPFVTTMQDNLMTGELRQTFDKWFDQGFSQQELDERAEHNARIEREGNVIEASTIKDFRNERIQLESKQRVKSQMQVKSHSFLSRVFKALAFPFFVFSTVILLATLAFALVQLVTSGRIPLANAIIGNTQELVTSSASNVVNVNVNYGGQMLGENEI